MHAAFSRDQIPEGQNRQTMSAPRFGFYLSRLSHRQENDVGGFHGVLRGQDDAAVVDAALEVRLGGAADGEMPLEEIVLEGAGVVLGGRVRELLGLSHETLHS